MNSQWEGTDRSQGESALEDIAGVFYDRKRRRRIVVKKDLLLNQLRRDSLQIGKHFDSMCDDELTSLGSVFSAVQFMVLCGVAKSEQKQDEFFTTCSVLLNNASMTFAAALTLLRFGYRIQPGILVRNVLENVSTVGHLFMKREDLKKHQAGKLKSTDTIKSMKQIIPIFGKLYGFYSDTFAHISSWYTKPHPLDIFKDNKDPALVANIFSLKGCLWLIYITAELIYLDFLDIKSPNFWTKREKGKFLYDPTNETRKWAKQFFGSEIENI